MDLSLRWMIFAAALGFCVAYALWGPAPASAVLEVPRPQPAGGAKTGKPSVLTFEPAQLDFGDVRVGEVKTRQVRIHNPSAAPIAIEDIRGSCGCISLELKQKDVPARGAVDLVVHYTGLAGSAKRDYGIVATTDEESARANLPVHAQTISVYALEPALLFFDVKPGETEKTLSTRLKRNDGKSFAIRGVDVRNKRFKVAWKSNESQTEYDIACTLDAGQVSAGVETITLITDHPTHAVVEIKASIHGKSSVAPLIPVVVGQWKGGVRALHFSVPIMRHTPGTLEISEVRENTNLPLTVELKRQSETTIQVDVTLTAPAPFEKNRRDGEFIIQTNVLPEPMRVPFTVPPPPAIR